MQKLKLTVLFVLITMAIVSTFMKPVEWHKKNHRFLLCVSSFKRPIFLSGQVFRLMNQTYQNFDISISVKGVDEHWGKLTLEQEWKQFKKDKRLTVRYDANRGQLHNLLDTVRDIDLNQYDYFCKIDDDDWYAPTYLETVNNELNKQSGIDISHSRNAYIVTENIDTTVFSTNYSGLSGPTMCFSRKVIDIALKIEKDPSLLHTYLPDEPYPELFIAREDRLLHHLARNIGKEQVRIGTEPQVIYGWQYRSVMRNQNYVKH